MKMPNTKTEYARIGAEAQKRYAISKGRKIDSILFDRDIGPDLTPDARDCLEGLSHAWHEIERDADKFLADHAKPTFPKGT